MSLAYLLIVSIAHYYINQPSIGMAMYSQKLSHSIFPLVHSWGLFICSSWFYSARTKQQRRCRRRWSSRKKRWWRNGRRAWRGTACKFWLSAAEFWRIAFRQSFQRRRSIQDSALQLVAYGYFTLITLEHVHVLICSIDVYTHVFECGVYVHAYIHAYTRMYMCKNVHVNSCLHLYIFLHAFTCTYMHAVCLHLYIHAYIILSVSLYMHVHACTCVYIYIYMHTPVCLYMNIHCGYTYIYIRTRVSVHIYTYIHHLVCLHMYIHAYTSVHIHEHTVGLYKYIYAYTVCVFTSIYMRTQCVSLQVYTCFTSTHTRTHASVHIHTYIHTYTHTYIHHPVCLHKYIHANTIFSDAQISPVSLHCLLLTASIGTVNIASLYSLDAHKSLVCITWCTQITCMGWLRLVGSLNLQVSFAKEPYKRNYILQKTPVILRSSLIIATP